MKRFAVISMALLLIAAMLMPVVAMADQSAYVGQTYYIKTNTGVGLNMRNACSEKSGSIIKTIPYGTAVTVQYWCENKKWAMVEYGGRVGYVYSRYLSATKPDPVAKKSTATENVTTAESIYAEGNPPLSLELSLTVNKAEGCHWIYMNTDDSVVTVVENGFYGDTLEDGTIDENKGIDTFRLDGNEYGFAEVVFEYVKDAQEGEYDVLYSITYYVMVDEHLDTVVYEQVVNF